MDRRQKLSKMIHTIASEADTPVHVYFQPPSTLIMKFPCIVYAFANFDTRHADNVPYKLNSQFRVTYIDTDPDSDIPEKIAQLPMCVSERAYIDDNKNYYPFRITI